jgi:queuine/archaeosine tRNA-ribosyltransferase
MAANRNPTKQNLFPIVQGGFDVRLREVSMQQVCVVCVCVVCGMAAG